MAAGDPRPQGTADGQRIGAERLRSAMTLLLLLFLALAAAPVPVHGRTRRFKDFPDVLRQWSRMYEQDNHMFLERNPKYCSKTAIPEPTKSLIDHVKFRDRSIGGSDPLLDISVFEFLDAVTDGDHTDAILSIADGHHATEGKGLAPAQTYDIDLSIYFDPVIAKAKSFVHFSRFGPSELEAFEVEIFEEALRRVIGPSVASDVTILSNDITRSFVSNVTEYVSASEAHRAHREKYTSECVRRNRQRFAAIEHRKGRRLHGDAAVVGSPRTPAASSGDEDEDEDEDDVDFLTHDDLFEEDTEDAPPEQESSIFELGLLHESEHARILEDLGVYRYVVPYEVTVDLHGAGFVTFGDDTARNTAMMVAYLHRKLFHAFNSTHSTSFYITARDLVARRKRSMEVQFHALDTLESLTHMSVHFVVDEDEDTRVFEHATGDTIPTSRSSPSHSSFAFGELTAKNGVSSMDDSSSKPTAATSKHNLQHTESVLSRSTANVVLANGMDVSAPPAVRRSLEALRMVKAGKAADVSDFLLTAAGQFKPTVGPQDPVQSVLMLPETYSNHELAVSDLKASIAAIDDVTVSVHMLNASAMKIASKASIVKVEVVRGDAPEECPATEPPASWGDFVLEAPSSV